MVKSALTAIPLSSEDHTYFERLRLSAFNHFRDRSSSFEAATMAIGKQIDRLPSENRAKLSSLARKAIRGRRADRIPRGETLPSIIAALGYWDFLLDLNAMNLSFLPNQESLRASIRRKLRTDTGVDPAIVESLSELS